MAGQADQEVGVRPLRDQAHDLRTTTRPPEGDLSAASGDGTLRWAISRRFVAMSRRRLHERRQADLYQHELVVVVQIDGLEVGETTLVAAIGTKATAASKCPRWPTG